MREEENRAVRLTPPPRVEREVAVERPSSEPPRRWSLWLTAAGFALLALVASAVFLLLPGWVAERGVPSAGAEAPESAEASEIVEDPGLPAERTVTAGEGAPEAGSAPQSAPGALAPAAAGAERRPSTAETSSSGTEGGRVAAPSEVPSGPTGREDDALFQRSMGAGLEALAAGEGEVARQAFQRALELRPDAAVAAEGLARAEEAVRLARISEHRRAALEQERAERWSEAVASHEAALALDPTLDFAQRGVERSRAQADLDHRLEGHLARPDRLSSADVLAEAEALLEEVDRVPAPGPRLADQRRRLAALVDRAATPVEVVLESDGETEVTLYRVGVLGRFKERRLELRPGTYVVVGRRSGYRDVRRELEVTPDGLEEPLNIRCEERI